MAASLINKEIFKIRFDNDAFKSSPIKALDISWTEPLNLSYYLPLVKISKFLRKYFIKYIVSQCIIHKSIEPKT